MQVRVCLFSVFSIFAIASTIPEPAAGMDGTGCTIHKEWQDAFNKGDASAVAALYTSSAIEVTPLGIRTGPAAVKERIEESIKEGSKNLEIVATECDPKSAFRWSAGSWNNETPRGPASGFWTMIEVKYGDGWKIQNLTFNLTPPPQK
jgi:ketosteroid isomerase-like protein